MNKKYAFYNELKSPERRNAFIDKRKNTKKNEKTVLLLLNCNWLIILAYL